MFLVYAREVLGESILTNPTKMTLHKLFATLLTMFLSVMVFWGSEGFWILCGGCTVAAVQISVWKNLVLAIFAD